jgi:hypothetical protein
MTRVPEVMLWCRKLTRTRATRSLSHGILRGRNIQDKAASDEVPRLARAKRARPMEWVTKPAVTQHARPARCVAHIVWLGCDARMASSTAAPKGRTKGGGWPSTIGVSRPVGVHTTIGCDGRLPPDETLRASDNGRTVAGPTVERSRMGRKRYPERNRSTQLPLNWANRQAQQT